MSVDSVSPLPAPVADRGGQGRPPGGPGHGDDHGGADHGVDMAFRIGPNAIIQMEAVLRDRLGAAETVRLLTAAGLSRYLDTPPGQMVDEREVNALHRVLRAELGVAQARRLSHEAGQRTGDYLLAHRIPKPVQVILKLLPAPLASRVLLSAIGKHSWTFSGSGTFTVRSVSPAVVSIENCPIARGATGTEPVCDFYTGTFERLYRVLVHPRAQAEETECEVTGAPRCTFEVRW
ncbi:bacteriochlorophyll 4-vinyl reductase [Rhodocista pekingensis]|uniref:Bacteriochlorophyll 4-vinyl reductase n=1 Tax=Rhodocista pekingensis TaxID=201185 RepID=A0ABW2KZ54_9PROT